MSSPTTLSSRWRTLAGQMRSLGAVAQATTLEHCADELEETWREWELEALTLEEAAAESGYSYSSLQKRVSAGEIPNVGEPRKPRVRRQDLPRKTPTRRFELESGEPDLAGEILVGSADGGWSHDG